MVAPSLTGSNADTGIKAGELRRRQSLLVSAGENFCLVLISLIRGPQGDRTACNLPTKLSEELIKENNEK